MIYFDNAATSFPKPPAVGCAVNRALTRYGANPGRGGHDLSVETARQVFAVRSKAAALLGAEDETQVVFTQNCTHALNQAIRGLLRPGEHVILSDLEHNAVTRPVYAMALEGTIGYSVAETFPEDDARTVESFRRCIRARTRAIVTTHASNVFGVRMPIAALAHLAQEYGLLLIVDAAQTAGVEPIDLAGMGIDFLCVAGHKGLYGPTGTGLLLTAKGELLTPLMQGGTGSASADPNQPDFLPDRLESGTLNTAGILGLGAGIDFVSGQGVERLGRYECSLARQIHSEIADEPNVILYTPAPSYGKSLPVISFNIKGQTGEQTAAQLNEAGFALRGGLHCAPFAHKKFGTLEIGTARISVGAFHTQQQGHELARQIAMIARKAC